MLLWTTPEPRKKRCRGYRRLPNRASGSSASMRRTNFGVVPEMPRTRLPDRRKSVLMQLEHQGARYDVSIGLYENNRPVLLGRALQLGDSIEAPRWFGA